MNQTEAFLNPQFLLAASVPHDNRRWMIGVAFALLAAVAGIAIYLSGAEIAPWQTALIYLVLFGAFAILLAFAHRSARKHREERETLTTIEEKMQLRSWDEAAARLHTLMSTPMKTQQTQVQATVYLAMLLTRYHRFDEAIEVYDHLEETVQLDPAGEQTIRLGRAMALLRADRLYDVDKAINELKRNLPQTGSGSSSQGMLLLVQMYRDVKTGHPDEAIQLFDDHFAASRKQLGHRSADAWALAAAAHDALGATNEAAAAWKKATLLAPVVELVRRYPEIHAASKKYEPTRPPGGSRPSAGEVTASDAVEPGVQNKLEDGVEEGRDI